MNPLFLGSLLEMGRTLINRLIPDPAEKAKAELELMRMAAEGELKQVLGQLEINAREAQHPSIFVAGWRPAMGWVGGTGFGYAVLIQPLAVWLARINGWPEPPVLDTDLLWIVISGMLGIGGLRSIEKVKGVAAK